MVIGLGNANQYLNENDVRTIVESAVAGLGKTYRRVLVIIPDGTRTMPMPMMYRLLQEYLAPQVKQLDFLIALGTHQPMTDDQISRHLGVDVVNGMAGQSRIFNHFWNDPKTFITIGTITAEEIRILSGGLMARDVVVSLNRLILDYDLLVICGPVFPHEVAGFSGGTKYFFPGIAGREIINFTHWLGALITNYEINGAGYTPVRAVIDRAASFIPRPAKCFALVVTHEGLSGLYFGDPQGAWKEAADLSSKKHIIYVDKPFKRVLSIMPEMYDDLWTAAKGMYKMEPAVADGGEVVVYAPHITEVSYSHGKLIDEIGYHCRDYFLKQWDKFSHYPGGILAHSTHLKGIGEYDPQTGIESPRIRVSLATGIPEERCRRLSLGYIDPASIHLEEWMGREAEGIVVIPRAGEMLYRLKK